jgi:hypothetical protein
MSTNPVWEDVQRLADDVEVQVHLAGMDARDRWHALEQRVTQVEKAIAHSGEQVSDAVSHEISEIHAALVRLRDDMVVSARGDFVSGW